MSNSVGRASLPAPLDERDRGAPSMLDPFAINRRQFAVIVGAAALPAVPYTAESLVAQFQQSLTADQKRALTFPFDHPLRSVAYNNWKIVEPRIEDLAKPQRDHCRAILESLCTDDGLKRFDRQMSDDYGGFSKYHVAVFGEPGASRSEWVMTGRHLTIRAGGASSVIPKGPLFFGHSAERRENLWDAPGKHARALFASLDPAKQKRASEAEGLATEALDPDQAKHIRLLADALTQPFRRAAMPLVNLDGTRIRLNREGRVWKLEGRDFAWFHHADPHAHCWLTV